MTYKVSCSKNPIKVKVFVRSGEPFGKSITPTEERGSTLVQKLLESIPPEIKKRKWKIIHPQLGIVGFYLRMYIKVTHAHSTNWG